LIFLPTRNANQSTLVCARSPGSPQYSYWQSRSLQHCTHHWPARRRCSPSGRGRCRCQSLNSVTTRYEFSTFSMSNTTQTIAFALIDKVESRASDLQQQAGSLGMTLTTAIDSYSGLQTKRDLSRGMKAARRQAVTAAA
jgi:hypothetical protein